MLRHERRLLLDCLLIGAALTLLVVVIDAAGLLTPAENFLYDLRARTCQHFTPPPSDKLVYLDIDDQAWEVIGAWPWPRRVMARIFDEVRIAGPRVVETDVIYSEPQLIQYEPREGGKYEVIDNDAELAAAVTRLGNVITPASLEPVPREAARYTAMVAELRKDIELREAELADRIRAQGFPVADAGLGDQYYGARRDAIMQRLAAMKVTPQTSFAQVRAQLLPRTPVDVHPGIESVLEAQLEKYLTNVELSRFSFPVPEGMTHWTEMRPHLAPIRKFSAAAAGGAYVDYPKFGGVVRTLPLLLEREGRVYPQMGLALACAMLDADMHHMRLEGSQLVVPRQGARDLRIPLAPPRVSTDGYTFGCLMDVPWFGGSHWEFMYDWPEHRVVRQHVPLNDVWQACKMQDKIIRNNEAADDCIRALYQVMDSDTKRLDAYNTHIPPREDFSTRQGIARAALDEFGPFIDDAVKQKPEERNENTQRLVTNGQSLRGILELNAHMIEELKGFRTSLAKALNGKAVLLGWTATAAIADFVQTPLHERTPGMIVHGAVFNGIMSGEMWSRSPWWIAAIMALGLGLLTALAVGYFSPRWALAIVLALFIGYCVVNGFWMFDYANRIVGLAGPLTTILVVWGGCTLTRVVVESIERERITRRFSNYADTRLVDHVLENPDITFEGEDREVTVVFTDLQNFTALSERMGPKIVTVLNELLSELVPVIQKSHQGYINKFMGDGIMFFYNAPLEHREHASDAVATVLDMQAKLAEFNLRLRERGLPELAMRAGIASGTVVVGDAGGGGRSDYTCLGDAVNLSSRLESANKMIGTHTLINDRASELLDGGFLIRPIGRIQVVGQESVSMCYEPICRADSATDQQRELAAISTMMVDAMITRRFEDCLKLIEQVEAHFGGGKWTRAYRAMCELYLREPPPDTYDGRIILTEK